MSARLRAIDLRIRDSDDDEDDDVKFVPSSTPPPEVVKPSPLAVKEAPAAASSPAAGSMLPPQGTQSQDAATKAPAAPVVQPAPQGRRVVVVRKSAPAASPEPRDAAASRHEEQRSASVPTRGPSDAAVPEAPRPPATSQASPAQVHATRHDDNESGDSAPAVPSGDDSVIATADAAAVSNPQQHDVAHREHDDTVTTSKVAAEEETVRGAASPEAHEEAAPHSPFVFRAPDEAMFGSPTPAAATGAAVAVASPVPQPAFGTTPTRAHSTITSPRRAASKASLQSGSRSNVPPASLPPTPTPRPAREKHGHCKVKPGPPASFHERLFRAGQEAHADRCADAAWFEQVKVRSDLWRQIDDLTFQPNLDSIRQATAKRDSATGRVLAVVDPCNVLEIHRMGSVHESLYKSIQKQTDAAKKALKERREARAAKERAAARWSSTTSHHPQR